MGDDRPGQQCGNCGAMSAAGAVVCEACGVVLAAYASPLSSPDGEDRASPTAHPSAAAVDTMSTPQLESADSTIPPPAPTRPSDASDWRSLFDKTAPQVDEVTQPDAKSSAPSLLGKSETFSAPLTPPESSRAAATSPLSTPPKSTSAGEPARTVPARTASVTAAPASRNPSASSPARKLQVPPVTMPIPEERSKDGRRAVRATHQSPIKVVYAGIALLLGGCVLSLLLAMVSENSTAIGLAFLCTVPIGLILFVVGYVMKLTRKEGRTPRWQE